MLVELRIDNTEYVALNVRTQNVSDTSAEDIHEVVAAVIANEKLSKLQVNQVFDIVGQALDYFAEPTSEFTSAPKDWRDGWAD